MKKIIVFTLSLFLSVLSSQAISIAKIFGDHAVLQRDIDIPIWGWANPGERISITFLNNVYKVRTNKKGRWEIKLPPTSFGGPYQIKVQGKKEQIILEDIYIGDVWVCSGQSNMEFQLSGSLHGETETGKAKDLLIRHFKIPNSAADFPADKLIRGSWETGNPESVASFTAVGYYFAKFIREKHPEIPIGLINNSWGGSKIEPFMSAASFNKTQEEILSFIKAQEEKSMVEQRKRLSYLGDIPQKDEGMINDKAIWAASDLDDSHWKQMSLPTTWEKAGLPSLDGVVWFRKQFNLNDINQEDSTQLVLGRIDDNAEIWVNGKRIDNMFKRAYSYSDLRSYTLSNQLFKKGMNQITIRVTDTGGGGGVAGEVTELFIDTGNEKIGLNGHWKYKVGQVNLNFLYGPKQKPTTIYNKMVHPIIRFNIKGVLWYQGESNTGDVASAQNYEALFKTMIKQWRRDWSNDKLPFLFVQLASFLPEPNKPEDHTWAHLRWSQFKALELPATGMASAIDLGEANDIHPRNKKDVGHRLALIALNQVYGHSEVSFKNPTYKSHEVKDNRFHINFQDTGRGLSASNKYGYVNGFSIADEEGNWHWAKAKLTENKVIVWHPDIVHPTALRYAWHANALDANLFSSNALPVVPFKIEAE